MEFWDKIVNFWFYDIKKFLARIWDRPDLPATFRPIFGQFLHFKIQKFAKIGHFYVIKDFLCSKLDFGPKLSQIHYRWFSRASLDPKDVFYHFRKSKILNFVNFLSCYAVSYPNNHLTRKLCSNLHKLAIIFFFFRSSQFSYLRFCRFNFFSWSAQVSHNYLLFEVHKLAICFFHVQIVFPDLHKLPIIIYFFSKFTS